jgi:hypothetical protein
MLGLHIRTMHLWNIIPQQGCNKSLNKIHLFAQAKIVTQGGLEGGRGVGTLYKGMFLENSP